MKKISWIFGAVIYSFFIAMIPALILALSEIINWFMQNNHSMWLIYGTFFVIGLIIQFYRPLYKNS